jgi:hypothetical protein
MTIDTLEYVKRLEAAGVPRPQAEAHAQAMRDTVAPQLATKADLDLLGTKLEARMDALEARLEGRMNALEARTAAVESRLGMLQWMVGLNMAATLGVLIRLFLQ